MPTTAPSRFIVETSSADVLLADLGLTLVHPTSDRDLLLEFSLLELAASRDIRAAFEAETLSAELDVGESISSGSDFDLLLYGADVFQVLGAQVFTLGMLFASASDASGMLGFGKLGAATTVDAASRANGDVAGAFFEQDTPASVGGLAYIDGGSNERRTYKPALVWKFDLRDVGDVRFFCGFHDDLSTPADLLGSDDPAHAHIGVQFSTDRADVNWQFVSRNDAGAQVVRDSGVAAASAPLFVVLLAEQDAGVALLIGDLLTGDPFAQTFFADADCPSLDHTLKPVCGIESRAVATKTLAHYHAKTVGVF